MKSIILNSFFFPPWNNAPSNRMLNLSLELIKKDFMIIPITVKQNKDWHYSIDNNLLKHNFKKIKVIKFPLNEKFAGLFVGFDSTYQWLRNIPYVFQSLKNQKKNFIYSTGPPFYTFILGILMKIVYKKPLIIEYRDPWTKNEYERTLPTYVTKIFSIIENLILKSSDAVIFISFPLYQKISNIYPNIPLKNKSIILPSAMEPNKYLKSNTYSNKKLLLITTSTIVGKRNPFSVFNLIFQAKKKGLLKEMNFSYHIYGPIQHPFNENILKNYISKLNLNNEIFIHGKSTHDECLIAQASATMLIDISEKDVDYPCFPFHFWEYFVTGKKILFFGKSNSYKSNFIEQNKLGIVFPLDDKSELISRFENLLISYKNAQLNPNTDFPNSFMIQNCWKSRADKLEKLLSKLSKNEP